MSTKIITLDIDTISNIDLSILEKYTEWSSQKQYFLLEPGKELYKFLAYLSNNFQNSTIINIGTGDGLDALALSYNENNKVITYDYQDIIPNNVESIKTKDNIIINVKDFMDDIEILIKSSLILINIHPHDGYEEQVIIDYLLENKYTGLIVLSNTNVTSGMKTLWENIENRKYDITRYGFWGGTGIICPIDNDFEFVMQ